MFFFPIAGLLDAKRRLAAHPDPPATVAPELCRGSLGAWATEGTTAAKQARRPIFHRLFCPIATAMSLQTRQKLSSPGSLFASTPSAAQTPGLPDSLSGCGREPVRLAFKWGGGACLVQIEIDQSTSVTHRSLASRVFTYLHINARLPRCLIMHTHAKL